MTISFSKSAFAHLSRTERAEAIFRASQSEMRSRLWSAALGNADASGTPEPTGGRPINGAASLIDLLVQSGPHKGAGDDSAPLITGAKVQPAVVRQDAPLGSPLDAGQSTDTKTPPVSGSLQLGVNAKHTAAIEAASARTGIAPAALATIIDAEAAKKRDGTWNTASRNPRSSASGLTQFLASTWESEAERPGTFLNSLARGNGWLNSKGQVLSQYRSTLLSLRQDARCSIEAAADYAKANVAHFARAGIKVSNDPEKFAQLAYLGHHLGAHDAVNFLSGGLSASRARKLLSAQVGSHEAKLRIERAGCPATAHRKWLAGFVNARIDVTKFMAVA